MLCLRTAVIMVVSYKQVSARSGGSGKLGNPPD